MSLLAARRTPVTSLEMLHAFASAAPELERPALVLLVGHSAFETGHWVSMWGFNIGNAKRAPGGEGDYQFLPLCDEYLKPAHAAALVAKARPRTDGGPGLDAVIGGKRQADGDVQVIFYPSNPADSFAAFRTLDEGVREHLAMLRRRFGRAWAVLETGDAFAFCAALHAQGYFTAEPVAYGRRVAAVTKQIDDETYVLAALPRAGFASIAEAQAAYGLRPTGAADEALRVELAIHTGDVNP